ncbi:NADH dehydrogenase subunit 5 [Bacillus andreraoultii]|uniref:NADH dehydrogenase subunit 5 n=1 Tax=Bacillus andreraoultii TaxID=1499685 RepID=UPI0005397C51|nr:NADH dehydrogenase subunit 5 [Bacillus andreraoultii]
MISIDTNFYILFFIVLSIPMISSAIFLIPKISYSFIHAHTAFLTFGPIVSLLALISHHDQTVVVGPFQFDSFAWLLATFILTISFVLQRFSVRYLFGDQAYRKYFFLFTLTTVANALAWFCQDMRFMILFFGCTLFGLFLLIGLKREWKIARKAALLSGQLFFLSILCLTIALIWLGKETGTWQLQEVFENIDSIQQWTKTCINLLFVLVVIIPAAQWPFSSWLLNSVVAPTPVSAVMHAGIVNAGGLLLTRFSPLFQGDPSQIVLILVSSISVFIGTGIMLIQVDYKRQLVGSTMAQMGFMLIQCGLGAYTAAITHAILHGLFKATLFLQSGSALQHVKQKNMGTTKQISLLSSVIGILLGIGIGIGLWMSSSAEPYQIISAIILGWSAMFSWVLLVGTNQGWLSRIVGTLIFIVTTFIFLIIHHSFTHFLGDIKTDTASFSWMASLFVIILLTSGTIFSFWLNKHQSSPIYIKVYFWLVRLGEPKNKLVESHPNYLTQQVMKGGN